ncbi:oligosaccharide flippase family protein [Solirubrobacter taibaiensis]|nr:oligosaccharide flippase family protein [Solirubrobacter taibaiensis]
MSEQAVTLPAPPAPLVRSRLRLPTGAALLSIGTLASGVLAYVFNLAAARALGPVEYGSVAVLWAAMFLVSVVLFRPAEQTLARNIAERQARGEDAMAVVRTVGWLTLGALAAVCAVFALAWTPLTDAFFNGRDAFSVCLLAGIAAYAASYYARGVASGLQWLSGYGVLLLIDGLARVVLLLPLLMVASAHVASAAIVGAAVLGTLAPLALRGFGPRQVLAKLRGTAAGPLKLGDAARFAVPVGVVAGAEQTLVSGGALLAVLTASGDAAAAGTVFAATMLVRAPVFLFQGVAAALLPRFTELHTRGEHRRIRRALLAAGAGTLTLTGALVAGALVCGPELMRLLFGPGFDVARGDLAILSAGVGCYLAAATLTQAALARELAARTALAWLTAAVAFVAVELFVGGSPLHGVSVAFTVATGLAAAGLALVLHRSRN